MIEQYQQAWDELTAPGAQFATTRSRCGASRSRCSSRRCRACAPCGRWRAGYGDRDYVVYEDERYTFAEADAIIRALAARLVDVHGVQPGDRVALAMRNYPEWVFGYWAVVSIGAAVVGMNAWWTTEEMQYGLSDSKPKVLIADGERVERVLPVLDALRAEAPLHLDHRALRRRPPRRRRALGGRDRSRGGSCRAPERRHRPRRRRLHLLHLGHHRVPQGRAAHPSRLGAQPAQHRRS